MKRGTKTALIWAALLGIVFFVIFRRNDAQPTFAIPADQALELIHDESIVAYRTNDEGLILESAYGETLFVDRQSGARVVPVLVEAGVPFVTESGGEGSDNLITWLIVALIVIAVVMFFLRRMGGGGMNNIFEMRKTKSRPIDEANKAQFTDIGGNRAAVETLADIVDFLRDPKRWTSAGTRLPRGILLVGPPGTGKTLLARAVAGETQSAFFYTSAAEFVEMFVGIGAARVRDTFEKAASQEPAVVFIDELDAIGRRRGASVGTMHEEREQTLNQLLVLMDGLEQHRRLVVMAATNRPDVLDPALLRSGRFDRMLRLEPPTTAERVEILRIHTREKPLDDGVVLERIAEQTEGFTGADLETLANDAALLAVRRTRDDAGDARNSASLTIDDFETALAEMMNSNRQFDRLDSLLVESVSQFAEPTGRAVARVTLTTGTIVEGTVVWMNAAHIKLRTADGEEVIVAKEMAEQIVPLAGTESAPAGDFVPDRWSGRNPDVG